MSFPKIFGLCAISLFAFNSAEAKPILKKNKQTNLRPDPARTTLGLGVGMSVPSEQLDTFILRVRVNPNFTLEPMVNMTQMSTSESTTIIDATGPSISTTTVTNTDVSTMGGGLSMRYRVGRHGNTDLNAIAGVGYVQFDSETSVEGVQGKVESSGDSMVANLGLGMESFFAPKWSAGFDVTTPIYQKTNSTATSTSSESVGMAFAPSFKIMLAHYF